MCKALLRAIGMINTAPEGSVLEKARVVLGQRAAAVGRVAILREVQRTQANAKFDNVERECMCGR